MHSFLLADPEVSAQSHFPSFSFLLVTHAGLLTLSPTKEEKKKSDSQQSVCHSLSCKCNKNLQSPGKREPQLKNFSDQTGLWSCLRSILLTATVNCAIPRQADLGCLRKAADQVSGKRPGSSIPLVSASSSSLSFPDDRLSSGR